MRHVIWPSMQIVVPCVLDRYTYKNREDGNSKPTRYSSCSFPDFKRKNDTSQQECLNLHGLCCYYDHTWGKAYLPLWRVTTPWNAFQISQTEQANLCAGVFGSLKLRLSLSIEQISSTKPQMQFHAWLLEEKAAHYLKTTCSSLQLGWRTNFPIGSSSWWTVIISTPHHGKEIRMTSHSTHHRQKTYFCYKDKGLTSRLQQFK